MCVSVTVSAALSVCEDLLSYRRKILTHPGLQLCCLESHDYSSLYSIRALRNDMKNDYDYYCLLFDQLELQQNR